jgi:amicyanin
MKIILLILAGATLFTSLVSAGGKNEVTIDNFSFKPATLTITAGTTVTWVNRDDVPHTVVSTDKKTISSPALDTDEKFSFKFTAAGTNDYYCTIHPHMKGRIVVQ